MKNRMSPQEYNYNFKRKKWFDQIYPLVKQEKFDRETTGNICNQIAELALHILDKNSLEPLEIPLATC